MGGAVTKPRVVDADTGREKGTTMRFSPLLLVASAALATGCPRRDEATTATPAGSSSAAHHAVDAREPSLHGPPVVLRLKGTGDGSNEIDLTIEIDVLGAMAAPATLRILVPAGATLSAGNASETISVAQRGSLERKVHVKSPTPITDRSPVEVVLEARDLDAGVGFHAERQWPPHPELVVPPSSGPRPPGGRPPMTPPPLSHRENEAHSCFGPRLAVATHLAKTAFASARLPCSIRAVPQ